MPSTRLILKEPVASGLLVQRFAVAELPRNALVEIECVALVETNMGYCNERCDYLACYGSNDSKQLLDAVCKAWLLSANLAMLL